MIPLDSIVALAAVLAPERAVGLLAHLEHPAATEAARKAAGLVQRPRVDRAAALARSFRSGIAGAGPARGGRDLLLDRLWRDMASWSRERAGRPGVSSQTRTPLQPGRHSARHDR